MQRRRSFGRRVRAHAAASLATERDAAFLRMLEAVDDVEHRALAGPVRADDRADLVLADVEADVGERLHATKAQADVLDVEDDVADFLAHAAALMLRP